MRAYWDGANITLYIDDVTQTVVAGSQLAVRVYTGVWTVGSAVCDGRIQVRRVR